jgi:hypothetical protein
VLSPHAAVPESPARVITPRPAIILLVVLFSPREPKFSAGKERERERERVRGGKGEGGGEGDRKRKGARDIKRE